MNETKKTFINSINEKFLSMIKQSELYYYLIITYKRNLLMILNFFYIVTLVTNFYKIQEKIDNFTRKFLYLKKTLFLLKLQIYLSEKYYS